MDTNPKGITCTAILLKSNQYMKVLFPDAVRSSLCVHNTYCGTLGTVSICETLELRLTKYLTGLT